MTYAVANRNIPNSRFHSHKLNWMSHNNYPCQSVFLFNRAHLSIQRAFRPGWIITAIKITSRPPVSSNIFSKIWRYTVKSFACFLRANTNNIPNLAKRYQQNIADYCFSVLECLRHVLYGYKILFLNLWKGDEFILRISALRIIFGSRNVEICS
jgi:hypothetical protein